MKRSMLVEISAPAEGRVRECSACGALGSAGCDCNAPLLPRVLKALEASPHKSNRAIAKSEGASEATVRRARSPASHDAPAQRVGLDGKTYKAKATSPALVAKLERHGWYQRAELAAQEARYASLDTCPRDAKMKKATQDVIKVWSEVLKLFD
jgi:hypothetical protein